MKLCHHQMPKGILYCTWACIHAGFWVTYDCALSASFLNVVLMSFIGQSCHVSTTPETPTSLVHHQTDSTGTVQRTIGYCAPKLLMSYVVHNRVIGGWQFLAGHRIHIIGGHILNLRHHQPMLLGVLKSSTNRELEKNRSSTAAQPQGEHCEHVNILTHACRYPRLQKLPQLSNGLHQSYCLDSGSSAM